MSREKRRASDQKSEAPPNRPTANRNTPKDSGYVNSLTAVKTVAEVMTAAEEASGSSVLTLLKATQPMVEHEEESYRLPGSTPLEVLQYLWQPGPHSLNTKPPSGDFRFVGMHTDPAALLAAAAEIDGDNWFGIHATPGAKFRGRSEDVTEMSVLHLELDWADDEGHKSSDLPAEDKVRSVVEAFPIRPTAVIESGGGVHLYWKLSEPVDPDTFERGEDLLRAAFEAEGMDVDRTDAASILRVPGTWNCKYNPTRRVTIAEFRLRAQGHDVTVELLEKRYGHLIEARETVEQEEADTMMSLLDRSGPGGPISEYNTTHTIADELEASGWKRNRRFYSRPGRGDDLGQSGRIVETDDGDEGFFVYSTAPELERLRSLGMQTRNKSIVMVSPFDLYVEREHDGDYHAALAAIKKVAASPPSTQSTPSPQIVSIVHPDSLWEAHPALAQIRNGALSKLRSPDGVLAAILARRCGQLHPMYRIPAIVGAPGSVNFIVGLVSTAGGRKSSTHALAEMLLPISSPGRHDLVLGSGEGLAELYYEMAKEADDDGKTKNMRRLVAVDERIVGMYVDEGEAIVKLTAERNGSTTGSAIRQAWSGSSLGNSNVGDNFRHVPKHTYRFAMVAAFQFSNAAAMVADSELGTAQRFLWAGTKHSAISSDPPTWPGPLGLTLPPDFGVDEPIEFRFPDQVVDEIVTAEAEEASGRVEVNPLDAHRRMMKLKVAGILNTIIADDDDILDVSLLSWELAEQIVATSDRLRDQIEATAKTLDHIRSEQSLAKNVHRAVATAEALDERKRKKQERAIASTAERLTDKVVAGKVATRKQAGKAMKRHRPRLDAAVDYAEVLGWLVVTHEQTSTKTTSTLLAPGPVKR